MEERIFISRNAPSHVWDMVIALHADHQLPARKPENAAIREGVYFLRRHDKAYTANELMTLRDDYPELYAAHEIHDDPIGERWMLEAGLLTDTPIAELAAYIGRPEAVVQRYSSTFYDIRPKLASRGYVLNHICMPAVRRGMHGRDYDFMYKTMAYCLGWTVFTEFVDGKPLSAGSRAELTQSFQDRLLKLGWLAVNRLDVSNYNGVEIIEQCLKLQELERAKGPVAGQVEAQVVLQALLTNCRTNILPSGKELCLDEPRVAEVLSGVPGINYIEALVEAAVP